LVAPRPGMKKLAGETLPDALMPLQPALISANDDAMSARPNNFHFILTPATISKVDMMATTNSGEFATGAKGHDRATLGRIAACPGPVRYSIAFLICVFGLGFLMAPLAQAGHSAKELATTQAERSYYEARATLNKSSGSLDAAWHFGRACFDWADLVQTDEQRAEIALEGIAACRQAIEKNPKSAPAYYYLALNLGQLARTKSLGALKLVSEMERELKVTIELDPGFDYAGGHRSIGLLYRDAPGWPASVGSRAKARSHLQKAVELSPDYPDNWLSFLEACLSGGEKNIVQGKLPSVQECLQIARKKFTGEEWALSWLDWDQRWQKIKAKVTFKKTESPRGKN